MGFNDKERVGSMGWLILNLSKLVVYSSYIISINSFQAIFLTNKANSHRFTLMGCITRRWGAFASGTSVLKGNDIFLKVICTFSSRVLHPFQVLCTTLPSISFKWLHPSSFIPTVAFDLLFINIPTISLKRFLLFWKIFSKDYYLKIQEYL